MKSLIRSLIGLVLSVSVGADPLIEGRVRLDSGEPVAEAQVRIFDMTDPAAGSDCPRHDQWDRVFRVAVSGPNGKRPS